MEALKRYEYNKLIRVALGVTEAYLAQLIGVCTSTIQKYEQGIKPKRVRLITNLEWLIENELDRLIDICESKIIKSYCIYCLRIPRDERTESEKGECNE